MSRSAPGEVDRLRREVERALRENLDSEDVLPLLARLARAAAPESEAWLYAHRHLAELGVEHDPWRAALFARRVIALRPDDDGAWAVLGLAQSLLANYRYAARAYERALALTPDNPWYAHNLGHLYDVALDRPADALPLLSRATFAQPAEADIAASYAHALARCGKVTMAKRILRRAIRHGGTADQMALARWLDAGAPAQYRDGGGPKSPTPPDAAPSAPAPIEGRRASKAAAKLSARTAKLAPSAAPPATVPGSPSPDKPGGDDAGPKKPRRRRSRERRTVNIGGD
jgi:tetratricopeptide (TPR) repeat protein